MPRRSTDHAEACETPDEPVTTALPKPGSTYNGNGNFSAHISLLEFQMSTVNLTDAQKLLLLASSIEGQARDILETAIVSDSNLLTSYEKLKNVLVRAFEPVNTKLTAILSLAGLKQGSRPVAELSKEFTPLAIKSAINPEGLFSWWINALDYQLRDKVLEWAGDWPKGTDFPSLPELVAKTQELEARAKLGAGLHVTTKHPKGPAH